MTTHSTWSKEGSVTELSCLKVLDLPLPRVPGALAHALYLKTKSQPLTYSASLFALSSPELFPTFPTVTRLLVFDSVLTLPVQPHLVVFPARILTSSKPRTLPSPAGTSRQPVKMSPPCPLGIQGLPTIWTPPYGQGSKQPPGRQGQRSDCGGTGMSQPVSPEQFHQPQLVYGLQQWFSEIFLSHRILSSNEVSCGSLHL